jgi:hypothetical protein
MVLPYLPTEVLHLIFPHLCTHCVNPEPYKAMPDFNTPVSQRDKKTLANVCLVNRAFRLIAQPILFHCSSLNGATLDTRGDDLRGRLVQFLHAIYLRPDLASEVRALSLIPKHDWANNYVLGTPLRNTMRKLGVLFHHSRVVSLSSIVYLILTVTTNVEYLRITPPLYNFNVWNRLQPLSEVKLLELVCLGGHHPLNRQTEVFRILCNLETVYVMGSSLLCEHHYDSPSSEENACDHPTWHVLPSSLQKVVFDYVEAFRLPHLFDNCPLIEDLELFMIHSGNSWQDATPPNGAFEERRHTLRRLVVNLQDWHSWQERPDEFEQRVGPEGPCHKFNFNFRDMSRLEFLGVHQSILAAEAIRATGSSVKVSEVLPTSLKTLHVGYVVRWDVLLEQLYDLHSAKLDSTGALKLTTVRFDPCSSIIDDEEIQHLLQSVGIALVQGYNLRGNVKMGREHMNLDGRYT